MSDRYPTQDATLAPPTSPIRSPARLVLPAREPGASGSGHRAAAELEALDLIERGSELAALQGALDRARAGIGGAVALEGAPGVGKSRLLAAARARARAVGMRVLTARGTELEREFAFGIALQLFGDPLQRADAAERARLLSGPASYAAPLFDGALGEDHSSSAQHRAALATGLAWLAGNLVWDLDEDRPLPLLIAIDDAHWSDSASLAFLHQLANRLPELPIAVAVTTRVGEPDAPRPALDALRELAGAGLLRPAPLSAEGVARVLRSRLGTDPDPTFARACAWATGGNPFLLEALVGSLRADRIPPTAAASAAVRKLVPEQVLRSVARRLDRLPADALTLARAAAVLGDGAPMSRAAALAELSVERAERAADALAAADVLQAGEPLSFRHPLIASAVAEGMGALAYGRAHRRAADLLIAEGAAEQEVAGHLLATRPEFDAASVRILRAAARTALCRGESAGAARLLRRALKEPPADAERPDLLVELAEAQAASGDPAATERLDEALGAISDRSRRARAMHTLSVVLTAQGEHRRAAEVAERALSEVESSDPLREPILTAYLAAAMVDPRSRPRGLERIAPIAQRARAGKLPQDRALVAQLAACEAAGGAPPPRVRALAQAALADDPLIEPGSHGRALGLAIAALVHVDELQLAQAALVAALAHARDRGLLLAVGVARHWLATVHYRQGQLDDAITEAEAALAIAGAGWSAYAGWSASVLAHARIETGELDHAREAVRLGEASPAHLIDHALVLEARGRLALLDGDPSSALDDFESAGRHLAERHEAWHPGIFSWRRAAALAAHQLGRPAQAAAHLAVAEREAERSGVPRPVGEARRVAGIIAGGERGIGLLRAAAATLTRSPARLEHARALIELGGALRRDGQRRAARTPLRQGLELADGFGARPLADTALAELRATGARPRRAALTGTDALTATEQRIARLAADGKTNPQIAGTLYITTKTVEWHLGHVYQKLDISSRSALPAALGSAASQTPGPRARKPGASLWRDPAPGGEPSNA